MQPKFDAILLLLLLLLLLPFLGPLVDDRPQPVHGVDVPLPFSATEFEFEFSTDEGVSLWGSWMTREREGGRERRRRLISKKSLAVSRMDWTSRKFTSRS